MPDEKKPLFPEGHRRDADGDELVFAEEEDATGARAGAHQSPIADASRPEWQILVVDDDEPVHTVTRLTLGELAYMGRKVQLHSAYSAHEAEQILGQNSDIAVILLDVVMESNHAGLDLVKKIRTELGNERVRIILRTGQPGHAPESEVIRAYDINHYQLKAELTAERLASLVIAGLRNYDTLATLEQSLVGQLSRHRLFEDLSEKHMELLRSHLEAIRFKRGQFVVREGEHTRRLYFIEEGAVEVVKTGDDSTEEVSRMGKGEFFGEMALMDRQPHSASIRASEPTILLSLSEEGVRALSDRETSPYTALVVGITKTVCYRLRNASSEVASLLREQLTMSEARVAMARLLSQAILLLCMYAFLMKTVSESPFLSGEGSVFVSLPLVIVITAVCLWRMWTSPYPLKTYGLTLDNWRASLRESLFWTVPVLGLMTLIGFVLVERVSVFREVRPFDLPSFAAPVRWIAIAIYSALSVMQEVIIRCTMQSSLEDFLGGPRRVAMAILVSNGLFAAYHLHLSLSFAALVFIPGLFWGVLFARRRSLVGVGVSHILIGVWAIWVMGFESILKTLL